MAEALICRRGSTEPTPTPVLRTETFISNTNWRVPNHTGNITVLIFGGGTNGYQSSISYYHYGGSGGGMNNGSFSIVNGTTIPITIAGAATGGSSSFGTYLSANGGVGSSGYRTNHAAIGKDGATQFGGGYGRHGGVYGGGGAGNAWDRAWDNRFRDGGALVARMVAVVVLSEQIGLLLEMVAHMVEEGEDLLETSDKVIHEIGALLGEEVLMAVMVELDL